MVVTTCYEKQAQLCIFLRPFRASFEVEGPRNVPFQSNEDNHVPWQLLTVYVTLHRRKSNGLAKTSF